MLYRYAFALLAATLLAACNEAAPTPMSDGGGGAGGSGGAPITAHPCFPADDVQCPEVGAAPVIAYCYAGAPGAAPFPNCSPYCADGGTESPWWCCAYKPTDPTPPATCR